MKPDNSNTKHSYTLKRIIYYGQGLSQESKVGWTFENLTIIYHINRIKVKNVMIITDEEKESSGISQHPLMIKTLSKIGREGISSTWQRQLMRNLQLTLYMMKFFLKSNITKTFTRNLEDIKNIGDNLFNKNCKPKCYRRHIWIYKNLKLMNKKL